ncbi:ankyrin-3-like [Microcaecilia unicolor]|uniref:Ankyrin-3-like n=1 Tax=Microcaecilia unicolor TaxID=1415580 RepID=A0A6P7Y1V6_9AMPH|nr:ankyrin-3-like [Microcaecilia unicolor]
MHLSSRFINPYATEVMKTRKEELMFGINNTDYILTWLTENGIFTQDKKVLVSTYRTRLEKNSRLLDMLVSQGERACRLFFYPCLKTVEPNLYSSMRNYVNEFNDKIGDGKRQLVGYLLEKDKDGIQKPVEPRHDGSPRVLLKKVKPKKTTTEESQEKPRLHIAKSKQMPSDLDSIFGAAAKGDLSLLKEILTDNDINAVNSHNETLLHVAASNGQVSVLDYLISKGAKLEIKDKNGRTPLHRASERGHVEAVRVLLSAGAKLYALDNESNMPLHLAAQNQHVDIVKMMLQDEIKKHQNRHNFLHMAALKDDSKLAQLLLRNGALVDAKDEKRLTPLHYAISQGFEKTARVLLEAGASIDSSIIDAAFNSNNHAIFSLLLQHSKGLSPDTMVSMLFKAVQANLHGIIMALIDRGTDMNAKNDMDYTPLLLAVELGNTESAQALIEKGAHLDERLPNLNTALHLAVQAGVISTIKLLIEKGLNANVGGPGDQTPLHVAAFYNKPDVADALVTAGAKIDAVTKDLATPLHIASQRGNVDVAQCLLQHKAKVNIKDKLSKTPLHLAAEVGELAMVELLLKYSADPNITDKDKKTPLHLAAMSGDLGIVKAMLSSKVRFGMKDMDGCTPLHYASTKGNMDIVTVLLTEGKNKNIDEKNIWRKTPLHLAAEHGHSDLIQLLLHNGASMNALDNNRDTPLHCACKAGHLNSVQTLVNWSQGEKTNLQATNSLKKTPLQVAEAGTTESHAQIVTFLKKKMLLTR